HPWTLADAALEYGRDLTKFWCELPQRLRDPEESEPDIFNEVVQSPRRCQRHHRMLRSYARHDYVELPRILDSVGLGATMEPVVLDVGGGTGTLAKLILEHLQKSHPEVQVLVLDLPEVLAQIEPSAGLWLCEGDLRSEWTVPAVPSMVVMARVLHDFHDSAALEILSNAFQTLKPGGHLIIVEFVLQDDGGSSGGLCDLHLLAVTGGP
ncbi:unnamed protein product, partial [Durusdinium trenchii]